MAIIPLGTEHTVTSSAWVIRTIQCEECRAFFTYAFEREGKGEAFSPLCLDNEAARNRAADRSTEELTDRLLTDCEPCRCPKCGCFQSGMVKVLQRRRFQWLRKAGVILGLLTFISFMIFLHNLSSYSEIWIGACVGIGVWLALSITQWIVGRRYDPNALEPGPPDSPFERTCSLAHGWAGMLIASGMGDTTVVECPKCNDIGIVDFQIEPGDNLTCGECQHPMRIGAHGLDKSGPPPMPCN